MRLIVLFFSLLTGCTTRKTEKPQPPPAAPGTSFPLRYPILAVGSEPTYIRVFPTEEEFTTTTGASSKFYYINQVIDSEGRLYSVGRVVPFGKKPAWTDMGTSQHRVFVETTLEKTIDLEAARKIVSDLVRAPRSDWGADPSRMNRALEILRRYRTLQDLIEGCSHTNDWR